MRVTGADLGTNFFNNPWHPIASRVVHEHSKLGFPEHETVSVKEDMDDLEATAYVSQAVQHKQVSIPSNLTIMAMCVSKLKWWLTTWTLTVPLIGRSRVNHHCDQPNGQVRFKYDSKR